MCLFSRAQQGLLAVLDVLTSMFKSFGGLITSTLLALFLLPVLYEWVFEKERLTDSNATGNQSAEPFVEV